MPNVTSLVISGMPQGRGRKGGVAPRHRKQVQAPTTRVPMSIEGTQVAADIHVSASGDVSSVSSVTPTPLNAIRMPPPPYPVYQYQYSCNPFTICFIKGNISTCAGCHNRHVQYADPPEDLRIRHEEWRNLHHEDQKHHILSLAMRIITAGHSVCGFVAPN